MAVAKNLNLKKKMQHESLRARSFVQELEMLSKTQLETIIERFRRDNGRATASVRRLRPLLLR
jgi:hypothetical protein